MQGASHRFVNAVPWPGVRPRPSARSVAFASWSCCYTPPTTGTLVPLLYIAPSKFDTERLIP